MEGVVFQGDAAEGWPMAIKSLGIIVEKHCAMLTRNELGCMVDYLATM